VGVLAPPRSAAADDAPIAFIRALGNQPASVIRSEMPLAENAAYFRQMIHRDFDLTGICRFVLAPYWRIASRAERHQFRNLFADRLVRFYGRRPAQSGDGDFVVTDSRAGPEGVVVISQIVPRQGASIAIGWRLGLSDGVYKIRDVAIDRSAWRWPRSEIAALIAPRRAAQNAARDDARRGLSLACSCAHRPLIMQQLPRKPPQEE
jgi:ABC-type transporter MlaC component